jgi:adenylate cyclase
MAVLEGALERAHAGQGQVIGVVAEPGTGKSRLCYEFLQRCRSRGVDVYEAHAVPHGKAVPLLLILELTRAYLGISELDSDRVARDKAAGRLLQMGEAFREALPLVFDFLGIADPAQPAPTMDPEERERRIFAISRQMYQMHTQRQTSVTLFEDLHWMDAGSAAFVTNTAHIVGGLRMLMLVNFRPEYHADWMQKSFYQQLAILPLGRDATDELLDDLLGSDAALAALRALIHERSGGNPFFVEEIVQSLVEAGSLVGRRGGYRLLQPIQSLRVPASVQSLLAARVDRLGEREKRVLQTAAVIGKEFSEPVLRRVLAEQPDGGSGGETHALAALRALVDAEFVHEQALYPVAEYAFKHPLTQEVAYQSQLADRRVQVHRAVAAALEALYPEKLDERAALLAYHCEAAGDPLRAAQWHRRAAQWVVKNSQAEALRHWRTVRALLATVPESPDAVALSLEACGALLNLLWRFGAPEEEAAALFDDGVALAERTGNASALVVLHSVYGAYAGMRGDIATWVLQLERAVALAEQTRDPLLLLGALAGQIAFFPARGRLDEALRVAERALSLPPDLGPTFWGLDSRIFVLCIRASTLANMGRLEESRQQFELGMRIARDRGELEPLGWLHSYYLDLAWFAGDAAAAHSHARHAVEVAEKIGVPGSVASAQASLGTAHLMNCDWPAATRALERAITIGRERGHWQQDEPAWLADLAEAYLGAGRQDEAERTASEALALAQARGVELHELRAWYALARVVLRTDAACARDALARATALVEQTHAHAYAPLLSLERAELARLLGDEATYRRERREAHRLFTAMGATGHVARVAAMIADGQGSNVGEEGSAR